MNRGTLLSINAKIFIFVRTQHHMVKSKKYRRLPIHFAMSISFT